jgi:hypothetical protein
MISEEKYPRWPERFRRIHPEHPRINELISHMVEKTCSASTGCVD